MSLPHHSIRARPPRGDAAAASLRDDPDLLSRYAEDAAHFPGGQATAVATPRTEADVADVLRRSRSVLAVGAQSSLTGGATPRGDVVLTTVRMNQVVATGESTVRAQPGVTLTELDHALRARGHYYPPAPTFMGATLGGIVATNAAGAATFKYGTTRDWVRALTVVLASGDVLDLVRGDTSAGGDGVFEIVLADRTVRVPAPPYRMPRVPKVSAGYFAAPAMDLVDLFVGSEGTLGIVTEVTLLTMPRRPAMCLAFVPFASRDRALSFVARLRKEAIETWNAGSTANPSGLDVSAIEHMDARCLALLREDGADRHFGVPIPPDAAMAILATIELSADTTAATAFDEIGRFLEIDTPLARFCRALEDAGVLDSVEIAVPGDEARAAQLLALREAVPAAVNARVGRAQQSIDTRIAKTAADMIVPFEHLPELLAIYDDEFAKRGLDAAVWGHISDGNLHPNVIPRSWADVESGKDAIRRFGRETIRLGGSPLAEHGVGRNPIKQELLRLMYGDEGIEAMRAVKRALDPEGKLAPGVLFEESRP
jgi:D-lactate dehydrogenase (cytochrome)